MYSVKAIAFDLFNTLITIHPDAMERAHQGMVSALHEQEIPVDTGSFMHAYVEAATRFLLDAKKDGRETHNRFWIAAAIESQGYPISPEDTRIAQAVESYFSAFYPHCRLVPGTKEILEQLAGRYRLGLLTNFTHPPAALRIITLMGLHPFFQTVLISGELGYRKPHSYVFSRLVDQLGIPAEQVLFVGDDPEADVQGARNAGLQPLLTTCVLDENIPSVQTPLSPPMTEYPPGVPRISSWRDLLLLLEA